MKNIGVIPCFAFFLYNDGVCKGALNPRGKSDLKLTLNKHQNLKKKPPLTLKKCKNEVGGGGKDCLVKQINGLNQNICKTLVKHIINNLYEI